MKTLIKFFTLCLITMTLINCTSDTQEELILVDNAHQILEEGFGFDEMYSFQILESNTKLEMTGSLNGEMTTIVRDLHDGAKIMCNCALPQEQFKGRFFAINPNGSVGPCGGCLNH